MKTKTPESLVEAKVVSRMMELAGPSVKRHTKMITEQFYTAPMTEDEPEDAALGMGAPAAPDAAPEMPADDAALDGEPDMEGGEEDLVARLLTTIAAALEQETGVEIGVETDADAVPGEEPLPADDAGAPPADGAPELPTDEPAMPEEGMVDEDESKMNEMTMKVAEKLIELLGKHTKKAPKEAAAAPAEAKAEGKKEDKK